MQLARTYRREKKQFRRCGRLVINPIPFESSPLHREISFAVGGGRNRCGHRFGSSPLPPPLFSVFYFSEILRVRDKNVRPKRTSLDVDSMEALGWSFKNRWLNFVKTPNPSNGYSMYAWIADSYESSIDSSNTVCNIQMYNIHLKIVTQVAPTFQTNIRYLP